MRMIKKTALPLLFVCILATKVKANQPEIEQFRKIITAELEEKWRSDGKTENPMIKAYPFCYFTISSDSIKKGELSINIVGIDSQTAYGMIRINDQLVSTALKVRGEKYLLNRVNANFYNIHTSSEPYILKLVAAVEKHSSRAFFCYLMPEEKYLRNLMAFYDRDGHLTFVDSSGSYNNVTDLIIHRYGSKEKYIELLEDQEWQSKVIRALKTLEDVKAVLRKDPVMRAYYLPADTANNIRALAEQVASLSGLPVEGEKLLEQKIRYRLAHWPKDGSCMIGEINLLKVPVTFEIRSVLTSEQYGAYMKEAERAGWLARHASDRFYQYLKKEKNLDEAGVRQAYIDLYR